LISGNGGDGKGWGGRSPYPTIDCKLATTNSDSVGGNAVREEAKGEVRTCHKPNFCTLKATVKVGRSPFTASLKT